MVTADEIARFFARAIIDTNGSGCWLWGGRVNRGGYGVMAVAGRVIGAHRIQRGEDSSMAKVSNAQAVEIRALHRDGINISALARRYGICRRSVRKIVQGKTYKHAV